MPLRPLLLVLLCLTSSLSACGGGGGNGNQNQNPNVDPLQLIEGSWRGTCMLAGGVIDITIDPTGEVTQLDSNGVSENATGTFRHLTGRLYGITLLFQGGQTGEWRLLLDGAAQHAAFAEVDQFVQMIALQKNATTIPPRTLADYAPGQYEGEAARFDAAATLLQLGACTMDIDAGAEFDGQFGSLLFASPAGSPLAPHVANGTVLDGDYEDNEAATSAERFFVVTCPDGTYVAILAFSTTASEMLFFGLLRVR